MIRSGVPRKMVLMSIVAILSIAILALPAVAKHPNKKQLLIEAVYVNFDEQTITIIGRNFVDKKKETVVLLYAADPDKGDRLDIC